MCSSYHRDARLWVGLVAFVVGAVMLLERFDVVPAETWNYLWPAILIVTGLKWMLSGCCGSSKEGCPCGMNNCDCGEACEMPMAMPVKKMNNKKTGRKK
jgi:Domain of unknown function (DUF5668)